MATVRVFLCTYRRPQLLRRALASLLAQTHTDWICELHNDDPGDEAPRRVLEELAPGDKRFHYHPHDSNWGAVATFNHAYAGGPEPYASLLEDDNWWKPDFLRSSVATLEAHPDAALVWTNMHVWQESADGSWRDTGRTIWHRRPTDPAAISFEWPEIYQAIDALHSHGAMVFRPRAFASTGVPPETPLAIIEHVRERAARGPLLLLSEPLAHFALTLGTARSGDRVLSLQSKLLVAASYFTTVTVDRVSLDRLWQSRRRARPRDTGILVLCALALRSPGLLRAATASDLGHFLLGAVRHPVTTWRGLRFRSAHPCVWAWLLAQSQREIAARATARCSLLEKHPG